MKSLLLASLALISLGAYAAKPEKLLMGGSGWPKVVIVDKATKSIEWEYPLEKGWECNSVAALEDGNILFSFKKGARVVNRNKQTVWEIECPEGAELQSARALDNGNVLLAWGGHPLTVLELEASTGKFIRKTEYETGVERVHNQIRQVNMDDDGNLLIPILALKEVHVVSPMGKLIRKISVNGNPFTVEQVKKDIYMVAGGDSHILQQVNLRTGEILKTYESTDIEGTSLFFVAGLSSIKKGNLYICNWQGHSKGAKGPQFIEIDKNGTMVWSIDDNGTFGRISCVSQVK